MIGYKRDIPITKGKVKVGQQAMDVRLVIRSLVNLQQSVRMCVRVYKVASSQRHAVVWEKSCSLLTCGLLWLTEL